MKHSKIYNVIRNTGMGICNSLVLLGLNLLSRNLFLQYVGLEYLSMAQVINNMLTLAAFSELGLSNAVLYMLYKPVAQKNEMAIMQILFLYRRFNRYVGGAIFAIGLLIMPIIPYFIRTEIPYTTVYFVYILNLFSTASTYLYTYRSILLSANQKDYIASVISAVISVLRVTIQCFVIWYLHDYIIFLIVGIVMLAVQNLLIYVQTGQMYPFIKRLSYINCDSLEKLKTELKKNVLSLCAVRVAGLVINNTDTIIISWLNTLLVGLCANYMSICFYVKQFASIAQNALLHSVGISLAEKDSIEKYKLFRLIFLGNSYFSVIVIICLLVLWDDFIILWIGKEYLIERWIVYSLVLNVGWGMLISPCWIFRDASGLFVYVRNMLLCNAFFNLLFSVVSGIYFGAAGVFFSTVVADIFTNFWYDSNLLYKKTFGQTGSKKYMFKVFENIITGFVFGYAIDYLICGYLDINVYTWLVKLHICFFAYSIYYFLRYRKTSEWGELVDRLLFPLLAKVYRR